METFGEGSEDRTGCLKASLMNEMEIVAAELAAILNKVNTCSSEYDFQRSGFPLICVFFISFNRLS